MTEPVENMKEYPLLYRLWDLEIFQDFRLYIGFETHKNSEPSSLCRLWDLEKLREKSGGKTRKQRDRPWERMMFQVHATLWRSNQQLSLFLRKLGTVNPHYMTNGAALSTSFAD